MMSDYMDDQKKSARGERATARRHLRELIAALDRRVPHVERVGEVEIARVAAALRTKAVQRLAELEAERDKTN
jgi:hypothetical protein